MILVSVNGFSQQKKFKDLVGRWEIFGSSEEASLEVVDSSTIILSYMGDMKKIINYKIDFDKSPIWFDFSTEDSVSNITVKSLLEIMNDNMIKWQLFVDEDRPDYFSSSRGELFYLKKVKNTSRSAVVRN